MTTNKKEEFWKLLKENVTSILTISSGVILIILRQLKIVDDTDLLVAILGILTLLATTELIDRSKKLDKLEDTIKEETGKIFQTLGGIETHSFTNATSAFDFIAQNILESESSIDHAALAPSVPRWSGEHQRYEEAISRVLKANRIRYRYLARISESHRINRIAKYMKDPSIRQYYVKYSTNDSSLPYHNFMVFDNNLVIVNFPYEPGEPEKFLAIRHPQIVEFYKSLFSSVWKGGNVMDLRELEKLLSTIRKD